MISGEKFCNESGRDFSNIGSEPWREYTWKSGRVLRIIGPLRINVSACNAHRLFCENERSYYIPAGWIALTWQARDGAPHFVK